MDRRPASVRGGCPVSAAESPWDGATPVNTGNCRDHGPHRGLICAACVPALPPRWADVPAAREPAPRVYARVLDSADADPGV